MISYHFAVRLKIISIICKKVCFFLLNPKPKAIFAPPY